MITVSLNKSKTYTFKTIKSPQCVGHMVINVVGRRPSRTPTMRARMQLPSKAPQLEEASADKGEPYYYKQGARKDQEKSNGYR